MAKAIGTLNKNTIQFRKDLENIVFGLNGYWPLTVRQVFYRMVAALIVENKLSQYAKVSRQLKQLRELGIVPWEAIEDRTRRFVHWRVFENQQEFVTDELADFLQGYSRDLLQSQSTRTEVWSEKDALSSVFEKVASKYGVNLQIGRGWSSATVIQNCRDRIIANAQNNQTTTILYFGDLDPSGWQMTETLKDEFFNEIDEGYLILNRKALNLPQISQYSLPVSPDGIKNDDTNRKNYQNYLQAQGFSKNIAVELDAIDPPLLEKLIEDFILENLDLFKFNSEQHTEESELKELEDKRNDAMEVLLA